MDRKHIGQRSCNKSRLLDRFMPLNTEQNLYHDDPDVTDPSLILTLSSLLSILPLPK